MDKLEITQVREWLDHPVSRAIKENYLERLTYLREISLGGNHINTKTGQIQVTYAMDVAHAQALQMFLDIWEDPHGFKDAMNQEIKKEENKEK